MPKKHGGRLNTASKVYSLAIQRPAISILRILFAATAFFAVLLSCLQAAVAEDSLRHDQTPPANTVNYRLPDGTTAQSSFYRNPTAADLEQWSARKQMPVPERTFALQDYGENAASGYLPLTLAQGDFTRDGIPDLIVGSQSGKQGIISLRCGLKEALFPKNADWVTNPTSPFGREELFSIPISPNVIVTGDFNNDGLLDLVVSDKQSNSIFLLPGHQDTIFGALVSISLPGRPTAILSADLGAGDHLSALVVATEKKSRASVLVFQNRKGALQGAPDEIQLDEPVVAIRAGKMNSDAYVDLAISTASKLVLCYGSFSGIEINSKKKSFQEYNLGFAPDDMIVADVSGVSQSLRDIIFVSKERNGVEVFQNLEDRPQNGMSDVESSSAFQHRSFTAQGASALVSAELNGEEPKELILFDRISGQLSIMKGSKNSIFTQPDLYATDVAPIAVLPMRLNPRAIDVLVVLRADGTLRFMAAPPGAFIAVDTTADDIAANGTSNGVITLREAILLNNGGTSGDGLTTGLGRALTTGGCPGVFETCYISGTFGFGVGDIIVFDNTTFGGAGNTIRVSGPAARRSLPPIRDNSTTIDSTIACPASVPNCNGTLPGPVTVTAGLSLAATDDGLNIQTSNNVIRGLSITFFPDDGIEVLSGISNKIEACKIGVTGGNGGDGIDVTGTSTEIGGTTSAQQNIISGNLGNGIVGRSPGLVVRKNNIGTDLTGTYAIGNSLNGIQLVAAATEAIIGEPLSGNIISGNGAGINTASNNAIIQGNIIGKDVSTVGNIPNGSDGINITGRLNLVGGTAALAENCIRGNLLDGVQLGGTNNFVEGNDEGSIVGFYIGENGRHGVNIAASTNTVGGLVTTAHNLILGNAAAGVRLESSTSSVVQGNTIQTNGQDGVQIDSASNTNTIGGSASGSGNVINSNGGAGVFVLSGTGNAILSNSIFSNTGLGIDLGTIGVTPNDVGDGDAGPNNLQNFPILTAAVTASGTVIKGTLNSTNSTTFTIEVYTVSACHSSGNGDGETFVGSGTTTTSSTGTANITITLPVVLPAGTIVTASATPTTNNTSEFSACIAVTTCAAITLTSPPLPDGTARLAYSTTIVASGGNAPYAYSVSSGTLPTGLTLNSSTGVISGTPTVPGLYNFDITAMDSTGCTATQSYSINIVCGTITLTAPPLANGTTGVALSRTITASGGATPYSYAVSAGALPPGLTLNSSSGIISGTPMASGLYAFDITATDSVGCAGTQSYTLNIVCPTITLSGPSLASGVVGTTYLQTITASGGTAPRSFALTSGALPTGLSLNSATGVISGTPTAAGLFSFDITATDFYGCTGTQSYTINILCPTITLTAPPLPAGTVGISYVQQIAAVGGTAPRTFAVTSGALPAGLSLNAATGVISGTPSAAGLAAFDITATDIYGCSGSQTYVINIVCPVITLSAPPLPDGTIGWFYTKTISAAGGTGPYTYGSIGTLPTGLSLNPSTGEISGTPSALGQFSFGITVTDIYGCTALQSYTITIVCSTISLTAPPLPDGVPMVPYTTTITASGGVGPYTFTLSSGSLPAGLSLNTATGEISGTPTVASVGNFDITATDSFGCAGTQSYSITIACSTISLTAPPLPNAVLTVLYSTVIAATGGTGPYTYAVSAGATPTGITLLSDGTLSGTATVTGSFNFTVTATDSLGCTGNQAYTLVVFTLLFDDFEDGVFNWNRIKGSWFESGGNLIGTGKGTVFAPVPWNPSGFPGCSTCTIQVNDIVINSTPNVRIVAWYADNNNKVELILKEGKVVLKQTVSGSTAVKQKVLVPVSSGVPFDVELSYDGTNIEVKVNGTSAILVVPAGVPNGKVGFIIKKGTASFGEIGAQ